MTVIRADWARFTGSTFYASNNVWNEGSFVNGVDFTQTITVDDASFPNNTDLSWSWPSSSQVLAYPEVVFGYKVPDNFGTRDYIAQLSNLESVTTTYSFSISGDTDHFNVAFEMWLANSPDSQWPNVADEIMIWVHKPAWSNPTTYVMTGPTLSADVYVNPNWGDSSGSTAAGWQYVSAISTADMLSGTISISDLLKDLVWRGVLTGNEYFFGVELGSEVAGGQGDLHINSLSYAVSDKVPVVGTLPDQTFVAGPVGTNHVVGNAGLNTVVYLDNSTNYEAKSTPTGILVRKLGDMSSLDVLEGISDVRFNDRVFDRAAGWELACFLKGTRIATGMGGVPVEDLRIDDQVITAHGHERPVVWIGHRRIDCRRHPDPRTIWPVRIAAGVFGSGRPHRDLWLSPDHAVFVDNVLIPVKHLVNGTSIAQVRVDEVTYYHVELPSHDAILAEGLPAESYLDTGDRSGFANGGDPVALYPDFASMVRDAEGFAPLIVTGPRLDAVRGWLNDWAADAMASRSRLVANSHTAAGAAAVPRAPPSRNPRFVRHM